MKELELDRAHARRRAPSPSASATGRTTCSASRTPRQHARGRGTRSSALVYERYEERMRAVGAVDFDDLLLQTVQLSSVPEALAWYRGLWRYVLVDEYQDTNRAQYRLVRQLTGRAPEPLRRRRRRPVDLQLARRRHPQHPRLRARTIPARSVVKLEQNYRSTQRILVARRAVIDHNQRRKDKTALDRERRGRARPSSTGPGTSTRRRTSSPRRSSASRGDGVPWDGIARLLPDQRAVARARGRAAAQRACRTASSGACASTSARRSRTRSAYVRLAVNPSDDVAFRRAIQTPVRGIGPATLARLDDGARAGRAFAGRRRRPARRASRGKPRRALGGIRGADPRAGCPPRGSMTPPAFIDLLLERFGLSRGAASAERSPERRGAAWRTSRS